MDILLIYRGWFGESLHFPSEKIFFFLETKFLFPCRRLILPYQRLIFLEVRDLGARKFGDKYLFRIFLFYVLIRNKLLIWGRMAGFGDLKSETDRLKQALEKFDLFFLGGFFRLPFGKYPLGFDETSGIGSFHNTGQTGPRPIE